MNGLKARWAWLQRFNRSEFMLQKQMNIKYST